MCRLHAEQKAVVKGLQTASGQDEGYYTIIGIIATENMRAAHVLKMYTRERIHKVSVNRQVCDSKLADSAVSPAFSSSNVPSTTSRNRTCTNGCTIMKSCTLKGSSFWLPSVALDLNRIRPCPGTFGWSRLTTTPQQWTPCRISQSVLLRVSSCSLPRALSCIAG